MKHFLWLVFIISSFAACKGGNSFSGSGTTKNIETSTQTTPSLPPQQQNALPTQPIYQDDGCIKTNVDHYNFVLVFDASLSQKRFDPNNVRAAGASSFMKKLLTLKSRENTVNFNVSFIRFSTTPKASTQGWVSVTQNNMYLLDSEIQAATQNPNGSTHYTPALELAGTALQSAPGSNNSYRNFVVFLTDGAPRDLAYKIDQEVSSLVSDFQAAMIVIAAGGDLSSKALGIVQGMALPQTSSNGDENHIGRYKHAKTAQELSTVWDEVFRDVFDCQDSTQQQSTTPNSIY